MSAYISLPIYASSIDQRLRIVAGRCRGCGSLMYPQRPVCISCGKQTFTEEELSGRGTVYTYSVIAQGGAPAEFDDQQTMTGTIIVAVIELAEGPRVIAQLTDCEASEIAIGTPVHAVIRRLFDQEGIVRYGAKFTPAPA